MDNVISHAALAWIHYDKIFDDQYDLIMFKMPIWGKNDMWEDYYIPFCDNLKEMWDTEMYQYLKTLKE